jgi:hypothetical protein
VRDFFCRVFLVKFTGRSVGKPRGLSPLARLPILRWRPPRPADCCTESPKPPSQRLPRWANSGRPGVEYRPKPGYNHGAEGELRRLRHARCLQGRALLSGKTTTDSPWPDFAPCLILPRKERRPHAGLNRSIPAPVFAVAGERLYGPAGRFRWCSTRWCCFCWPHC